MLDHVFYHSVNDFITKSDFPSRLWTYLCLRGDYGLAFKEMQPYHISYFYDHLLHVEIIHSGRSGYGELGSRRLTELRGWARDDSLMVTEEEEFNSVFEQVYIWINDNKWPSCLFTTQLIEGNYGIAFEIAKDSVKKEFCKYAREMENIYQALKEPRDQKVFDASWKIVQKRGYYRNGAERFQKV